MFDRVDRAALWIEALMPTLRDHALISTLTDWIAAPGYATFELMGVQGTLAPAAFLSALLGGWFFWQRVVRISYFIVARPLGLAAPDQYYAFTRLWLPYQAPVRLWLRVRSVIRQQRFKHGPKQFWAGFWATVVYPFNRNASDTPIGRLPILQRIGLHMTIGLPEGGKHIACISYSGGGKTSWLKTWIGCLHRQQAAFIYDTDGTMAAQFGPWLRRTGHRVIKVDPDALDKSLPGGGWNIMDELTIAAARHGNAAVSAFVKILTEALLVEDSKTQPVFVQQARLMVGALIIFVWLTQEEKSMRRVRELLTRGMPEKIKDPKESPYSRLVFEMSVLGLPRRDGSVFDDGCGGALCEIVRNNAPLLRGSSADAGPDAPDSFRKTALYQTAWMDDATISPVINGRSDIACEQLKTTNTVVFMCATMTDTQTRMAPLVRAFTMMTLYAFQRLDPDRKVKHPCLFMLDEFPNLGRLDAIATAAPGFRRFGARLVIISQSIGLLREVYPSNYLKFLDQAEGVLWMGISPTDRETGEFLSRTVLGECLRKEKIDGHRFPVRVIARLLGQKLMRARFQMVARPLLTPQQCATFLDRETGQMILTREGKAPMRLRRLEYWKDLPVWRYSVQRGHKETLLRAGTRRLLVTFGIC